MPPSAIQEFDNFDRRGVFLARHGDALGLAVRGLGLSEDRLERLP